MVKGRYDAWASRQILDGFLSASAFDEHGSEPVRLAIYQYIRAEISMTILRTQWCRDPPLARIVMSDLDEYLHSAAELAKKVASVQYKRSV